STERVGGGGGDVRAARVRRGLRRRGAAGARRAGRRMDRRRRRLGARGATAAGLARRRRGVGAPGLEDEVGAWVELVRAEARLALDALRLVDLAHAGDFAKGIEVAFAVAVVWSSVRRAHKTVMGPRFGLQPVLGQRSDGTWSFRADSVIEGRNAVDTLARAALTAFATRSST